MSDNHLKANSQPHHTPDNEPQAGKRGLLLRFFIFMAWVAAIGLLLSLVACQPNEPKIFVIEELVECKNTYQNNITGIPILISTLKSISLYVSRTSCDERSNR